MSVLNRANTYKKGHIAARAGLRRAEITMKMLSCVSKKDCIDVMKELLRLAKTPGRGQLKGVEMFLKFFTSVQKQELEVSNVQPIFDKLKAIVDEDDNKAA